jgi:hypothetical protein
MNPMTMKGANRMGNIYAVDGMILCKYSMLILQVLIYIYIYIYIWSLYNRIFSPTLLEKY